MKQTSVSGKCFDLGTHLNNLKVLPNCLHRKCLVQPLNSKVTLQCCHLYKPNVVINECLIAFCSIAILYKMFKTLLYLLINAGYEKFRFQLAFSWFSPILTLLLFSFLQTTKIHTYNCQGNDHLNKFYQQICERHECAKKLVKRSEF